MSNLMKFNFLVIAFLTLSVAIMTISWGYSVPPVEEFLAVMLPLALFVPLALFYTYLRPDQTIATPFWNFVLYAMVIPPVLIFGQLVITFNFPLVDAKLAAFDQALGFEWPRAIEMFISLPDWVIAVSKELYNSLYRAAMVVAIFLIFSGQHKQLEELTTYFILTAILTNLISGFLPGASAFNFFETPAEVYQQFNPVVGLGYMDDFYALRNGSITDLKLDINGMVSFPSFHTVFALFLIYVMRNSGVFRYVIALWSIGIVLTTPFDGAHYIADLVGGAILVVATIAFVRWLEPRLDRFFSSPFAEPKLVPQTQ